jgi:predicted dehydrogenase
MRTLTVLRPDPARVLVVAAGGSRGDDVSSIVPAGCEIVFGDPARGALPAPAGFGAVVLAGVPVDAGAAWVDDLRAAVEQGACLLVFTGPTGGSSGQGADPAWSGLLGTQVVSLHPAAEWFAKTVTPGDALTRRLPPEFSFASRLVCLETAADAVPVLYVSIAFSDRPVVVDRRIGAGRVVTAGLGAEPAVLGHPELAKLFRRALIPPAALSSHEQPIGVGILGYGPYGGMGHYHGLTVQATDGLEIVAACDSDAGRRKAAEDELPGLRTYASAADLVADDDVDLVIVATPPSSHFSLALDLLNAGKHVALEKPMCLALREADTLIQAASAAGVALTVNQSRRFDADFVAVRRCVEAGVLGEVFNVETFVGGFEHPCRAWHSEASVSGGAVYDWGSHHLDWILQLMSGFPATLTAHGHKRVWHDITNLDQVRVRLAWEDGREAEFLHSDVAAFRRPKFVVQGTEGTLVGTYRPLRFERIEPPFGYVIDHAHHAEAPADLALARYEAGIGLSETQVPVPDVPRGAFHRNLADHLHFGEPLAVTADSAARVVALLEAAQQSTDCGNTPVSLPSR